MDLNPYERASVERRIVAIDKALAEIHTGQASEVAAWRRLLTEKEALCAKLQSDPHQESPR